MGVTARITLRSNPRLIIAFLLVPLSLAAGAALFFLGLLLGLIGLAAALVFSYTLVRFLSQQLASRIETGENGIRFSLWGEETREFPLETIRLAGTVTEPGAGKKLFVYRESEDTFISVPDEFEGFDALMREVESRTDFKEISLSPGESLKEKLKSLLEQGEKG